MYDEEMKKTKKESKKKEARFIHTENTKENEKKENTKKQTTKKNNTIKEENERIKNPVIEIPEEEEEIEPYFEEYEEEILENEEKEEIPEITEEKVLEEEKENGIKEKVVQKFVGLKTDWPSVLIKLLIFLVVAFLLIFVITKIGQIFRGNKFTDNLEKMKEVAYVYYKVENHRPANIDEEVSMTLQDMINGNLIKELKDEKKNICNKEYSQVSLTKVSEEDYDLNVYLTCGGTAQNVVYPVTYKESAGSPSTLLYELKRNVSTLSKYTCPSGYENAGRYCVKLNQTVVKDATPIYRIIPEENTRAYFKPSSSEYVYVDPILVENQKNYTCPSGYDLINGKCVNYGKIYTKTQTTYTCPNGSTPDGSRCLYTVYPSYNKQEAYCKQGDLINGDECRVSKNYSVRCLTGKKDDTKNSCYTTYTATKKLTDWLFDGKVTYRKTRKVTNTDTVKYEIEKEDENDIIYKKYVRKYVNTCDGDDKLSGSTCKHYDKAYEERYCTGDFELDKNKTECVKVTLASFRNIKGTYTCPEGYTKKGTGANTTCYKYENATKNTQETYYCSSKYDLTSDNKCVYTIDATLSQEAVYTCPEGYSKTGSGQNTRCYKKASTESYYYCQNLDATLEGTRCIIPEKTEFIGYRCPFGYTNSGTKCIDDDYTERINATKTNESSEEIIWSKSKEVEGWTWTGKTKEA